MPRLYPKNFIGSKPKLNENFLHKQKVIVNKHRIELQKLDSEIEELEKSVCTRPCLPSKKRSVWQKVKYYLEMLLP